MLDRLARTKLARAAARLNRGRLPQLPSLVFLTDDERVADPIAAIEALPRGSLVIVRARDIRRRAQLAQAVARVTRRHQLVWLVAGDPSLATHYDADGVHFPEARMDEVHRWRARRPGWLITCAAHSLPACARAARGRANAALLGPVFATGSHIGRKGLGALRMRFVALKSPVPVYALGGIDAVSVARLAGARLAGIAVVGAFAVE